MYGFLIWTKVPNLDLLSWTKNLPSSVILILAWNLETDISVTLISASWPLPTLMNCLSYIFITWTIRMFCKVTLSITIKFVSGFSYSRISIGGPSFLICLADNLHLSETLVPSLKTCPGNLHLQSSHSRAFQQYVLTHSPSFMLLFELSHSLRHSKWI